MPVFFTLLLVLCAVVAIGYIVVSTLQTEVYERASLAREEEGNISSLRKMVSPVQMARYRLNAAFAAVIAFFLVFSLLNFAIPKAFLLSVLLAVGASYLPVLYYRRKVAQRVELFNAQILELTNGLAAGMRAGLAFPAALEAVSKRIPWPMAEELKTVLREYRLGVDLPDALGRMNERLPSEDLTLLVGAVKLTTQSGGSLAEVMEKMTELIRARNDFQERLKNITAQGKFESVAMSVMPFVVFVILFFENRPLVMPLVTTDTGWIAIGIIAAMVLCGYVWIRRIVTIEV